MVNIERFLDTAVTEKFWDIESEGLARYDNVGDDIEGFISESLGNLADSGDVADFSTDCASVFDSPSLTAGFVSACWIDKNGKLGHVCYSWAE